MPKILDRRYMRMPPTIPHRVRKSSLVQLTPLSVSLSPSLPSLISALLLQIKCTIHSSSAYQNLNSLFLHYCYYIVFLCFSLFSSNRYSMGCSTSRIDHLPVVSLCHDRCKFLDEALYQSYALADAHLAYMHSLKSLGPSLRRFFDQNLDNSLSDCNSNGDSAAAKHNPLKSSPSPHHCPSSSNSESHLDFSSDSEDDEFKDGDVDPLHRIHTNYFERQTSTPSKSDLYAYHEPNKYDYFANNGGLFRSRASPYGASSPDGGSAWKTPSPPPPSGSTWEFLNFFDTYERYELPVKDKEGIHELKDELENKIHGDSVNLAGEKKQSKVKLTVENGDAKQPEVDVVQMNVISEKEKQASAESKNQSTPDIMSELENLFEKAAESGNPVLKILDTGKVRYYHKNSIYQGYFFKF